MKIAFVVQRYGLEVNGGAELHCRQVAERISKYYDVEVLTTCAIDYMTWKNEYAPGTDTVNRITVHRFPVDTPRDVPTFNKFSDYIFGGPHTLDDEIKWMKLQGPYSSKMLAFIKEHKESYDYFIFFTYLYCTTYFGLPLVKEKAILVPTAHDEPPIYLSLFNRLFNEPRAILYNTEEEKQFVNLRFNNAHIKSDVVGVGIEPKKCVNSDDFRAKYGIRDDFIIYVGRIDESKGCDELFDYFLRYKKDVQSDLKLVLVGKPIMKIPNHRDIISVGFISDEDKFNAINASKFLVMPSKYESLSMVLLEAWSLGKACLVNGNCEVLKKHCIKSNAGLWYENYYEFKECLNLLLSNSIIRHKLGHKGEKYVRQKYTWQTIIKKYISILSSIG